MRRRTKITYVYFCIISGYLVVTVVSEPISDRLVKRGRIDLDGTIGIFVVE